jgi:hypothetical protein
LHAYRPQRGSFGAHVFFGSVFGGSVFGGSTLVDRLRRIGSPDCRRADSPFPSAGGSSVAEPSAAERSPEDLS